MQKKKARLNGIYKIAEEDVVAREIQGEFLIIPITSNVGDLEDEIYTVNETGRAVWDSLDGKKTLSKIIDSLSSVFESSRSEIEKDVLGFTTELLKRGIIIEVK